MNSYKTSEISDLNIPEVLEVDTEGFDKYNSSLDLSDPKVVRDVLIQHFADGEHDTFFEILALYMNYIGKTKISHETKIPERTIYNFINGQHKTSSKNIFKVMRFISDEIENSHI